MICNNCGFLLEGEPANCSYCGTTLVHPSMQEYHKRNKALLPMFIACLVLSYLLLVFLSVMAIVRFYNNVQNTDLELIAKKYGLEAPEDSRDNFNGFDDFGYSIIH
jgi:hypothetical protein